MRSFEPSRLRCIQAGYLGGMPEDSSFRYDTLYSLDGPSPCRIQRADDVQNVHLGSRANKQRRNSGSSSEPDANPSIIEILRNLLVGASGFTIAGLHRELV